MAEFKRDFSGAKMNKDMDERVLPAGQYRDASNIQISTSDGSDVGSVQALLGNTEVTTSVVPDDYSTCVGVMPLPEKDLIYYFVAGGGFRGYQPLVKKDYIIEYDTITKTTKYVFVDIYSIKAAQNVTQNSNKYFKILTYLNGIRVGMHITGTFSQGGSTPITLTLADNVLVTDIVYDNGAWRIYHDYQWDNGSGGAVIPVTAGQSIYFQSEFGERVLQFEALQKINSINHLDGMIFWTDGITEPKKIHIERSKRGTGGTTRVKGWDNEELSSHANNTTGLTGQTDVFLDSENNADFHTRLVISDTWERNYIIATKRNGYSPQYAKLEHVTVIKKSPKFPLELEMSTTTISRTPDASPGVPNPTPNSTYTTSSSQKAFKDSSGDVLELGTTFWWSFQNQVDFREGDNLILTNDTSLSVEGWDPEKAKVRLRVTVAPWGAPNNGGSTGSYELEVTAVNGDVPNVAETWLCRLEETPALFEFKFPRFSYRYKYQDGEYSCFAPWTKVAFLPGDFDYLAKKGYNLGMRNRLRTLKLKNYFHEFALVPDDVIQVDLLYKEESSANVYTVKEITRKDGKPEWPDRAASNYNRGEYVLSSEMIHSVVPSNQMLRPWDNVPKSALTQEMTSNRLVFGNYKQNYNVTDAIKLDVGFTHDKIRNIVDDLEIPEESVKTLRTYQLGVVFLDEFGRETPVLVPKKGGSITLEKKWSAHNNSIRARLKHPSIIPPWAKFLKYYIKETSNEYYNLSMDRWYDAADGNVWLSFPSAERNKIDEDTYLILKNEHDSDTPVFEEGRYKVIAIENDAPTFVKTTRKSHGSAVTDSDVGTVLGSSTNIIINDSSPNDWNDAFGADWMADVYSKISPGSLKARIVSSSGGDMAASRWVGIVAIRTIGSPAEKSVKLQETIGDTADHTGLLSGTPSYRLEIREDIVEHKPEFDGRFFVKIYKDLLLQQKVMKEVDAEINLTIIKSFPMRFVMAGNKNGTSFAHPTISSAGTYVNAQNIPAPHQYHQGNYTEFKTDNGPSATWAQSTFEPGDMMGDCNARKRTKRWWKDGHCKNLWFIDAAGHVNEYNSGSNLGSLHNGVHPGHPCQNTSSDGKGFDHDTGRWGSSKMWLGFSGDKPSEKGGSREEFGDIMETPGTIFRFRDDPTNEGLGTAYIVKWLEKWAETLNFHECAAGCPCDGCSPGNSGCRRTQRRILFERLDNGGPMDPNAWDPLSAYTHDCFENGSEIDIMQQELGGLGGGSNALSTENPAIWETEPKEDVGLDIYYEASGALPLDVTHVENELLIPLYSSFYARDASGATHQHGGGDIVYRVDAVNSVGDTDLTKLNITPFPMWQSAGGLKYALEHAGAGTSADPLTGNDHIDIMRYDGSSIRLFVSKDSGDYAAGATSIEVVTGKSPTNKQTNTYQPERAPHYQWHKLGWKNCWQFGNGIESDRIRDDYNAPQLRNGVKASTVLAEPYAEEHRSSGLIWSGIFNSTSGVNNLNQFIQAEPITKDLNPSYGSLQRLVSRNTDTLAFCEDKVLNLTTDKDAIYKADGNPQLVASNKVIGQVTPIQGDYGISTNPESLAVTPHGMYWCDQMRGQVLSLEGNATIRSISDIGMKDYFNDNLQDISEIVGTYDDKKNEYNLTFGTKNWPQQFRSARTTVSFNELTKGWVSFKSFGPEHGVSMNNEYYTWKEGSMWQHHTNVLTNNFYGSQFKSDVTLIFNDQPGSVKSFGTINYEGTQARITPFTSQSVTNASGTTWNIDDDEYYNLWAKAGWYVDNMVTNLQEVGNLEFKNKEGKWFSTIKGIDTTLANLDEREFSVQGLGAANSNTTGTPELQYKIYIQPCTSEGATNWDSSADSTMWGWTNNNTPTGLSTTTIAVGYNDITIHNITYNSGGGVLQYSGLDLDAANFSTPGGTATTTGSGNSTVYIYTDDGSWNASDEVSRVEYTNNGIAGDPGNTVNCRIHYNSFTMPSSNKTICVDIDHVAITSGGGEILREQCTYVTYQEYEADHVGWEMTNITSPDITESTDMGLLGSSGAALDYTTNKHYGQVLQGQTTLIAEYEVTADANYHLAPFSSGNGTDVSWFTRLVNAAWEPYYTWTVTDTYYTTPSWKTTYIQKSKIQIYYTPPIGISGLDPDPISGEGNFCSFLHDIRIAYNSTAIITPVDRVTNVSVVQENIVNDGSNEIVLVANAIGTAKIQVHKLNAAGSATEKTYNFSTGEWTTLEEAGTPLNTTVTFTAGNLTQTLGVKAPDTVESRTFSVVAIVSGLQDALALDASVPTAINALNFYTVQPTGTSTFTPGPKTNMTPSGTVTIASFTELSTVDQNYAFTFTWDKSNNTDTISLNRTEVNVSDITGFGDNYTTNAISYTADNVLEIDDTTGVKIGMYAKDYSPAGGVEKIPISPIPTVTAIITNTSVEINGDGLASAMAVGDEFTLYSDWEYELVSSTITLSDIPEGHDDGRVTVTGVLKIKKYGRKGTATIPDGNIILQPNFITLT